MDKFDKLAGYGMRATVINSVTDEVRELDEVLDDVRGQSTAVVNKHLDAYEPLVFEEQPKRCPVCDAAQESSHLDGGRYQCGTVIEPVKADYRAGIYSPYVIGFVTCLCHTRRQVNQLADTVSARFSFMSWLFSRRK